MPIAELYNITLKTEGWCFATKYGHESGGLCSQLCIDGLASVEYMQVLSIGLRRVGSRRAFLGDMDNHGI